MKRLALAFLLLSSPAWAQPDTTPTVVTPQDVINLSVGQATKLQFPTVYDQVNLTSDVIVQVKPITDKVMTLQGLAEGETIMTVMAGNKEVFSATIIVGAERGHVVRIYDNRYRDYTGFYCTDLACGRADKELNGSREVSSTTVVTPGGTAITRTYGGPPSK
jgi:hypothetical protein